MGIVVSLVLILIGLALLGLSWRCSQAGLERPVFSLGSRSSDRSGLGPDRVGEEGVGPYGTGKGAIDRDQVDSINRASAIPLGITAGVTALGGLAALVSGWDVIGKSAAGVTVVILLGGLGASVVTARR